MITEEVIKELVQIAGRPTEEPPTEKVAEEDDCKWSQLAARVMAPVRCSGLFLILVFWFVDLWILLWIFLNPGPVVPVRHQSWFNIILPFRLNETLVFLDALSLTKWTRRRRHCSMRRLP